MASAVRRWVPAACMLLASLISYIDRNTLALLAPTILRENHLSGQQYGYIISAFSIVYVLSNPLWGRVLDRIGVRLGMSLAVFCWTLASASHAYVSGFLGFALARSALAFGEGATFPGGLRTVTQTLRVTEQARGIAVAYSGASAGAILTPLIVTPVALWWGWRAAFLFTGLIGLGWLAIWVVASRGMQPAAIQAEKPASLRLTDRPVLSFMLACALGMFPAAFILYEAANYLSQATGKSQMFIGQVLWIPAVGWESGHFVFGWLLDRMTNAGVPRLVGVRRVMRLAAYLSLPLALVPWTTSTWGVLSELFIGMFITTGFAIPALAYATHIYSVKHSGLIGGLGSASFGATAALTMPLFGYLFDVRRYDVAFALVTSFPLLGYFLWAGINRGLLRQDTASLASDTRAARR